MKIKLNSFLDRKITFIVSFFRILIVVGGIIEIW